MKRDDVIFFGGTNYYLSSTKNKWGEKLPSSMAASFKGGDGRTYYIKIEETVPNFVRERQFQGKKLTPKMKETYFGDVRFRVESFRDVTDVKGPESQFEDGKSLFNPKQIGQIDMEMERPDLPYTKENILAYINKYTGSDFKDVIPLSRFANYIPYEYENSYRGIKFNVSQDFDYDVDYTKWKDDKASEMESYFNKLVNDYHLHHKEGYYSSTGRYYPTIEEIPEGLKCTSTGTPFEFTVNAYDNTPLYLQNMSISDLSFSFNEKEKTVILESQIDCNEEVKKYFASKAGIEDWKSISEISARQDMHNIIDGHNFKQAISRNIEGDKITNWTNPPVAVIHVEEKMINVPMDVLTTELFLTKVSETCEQKFGKGDLNGLYMDFMETELGIKDKERVNVVHEITTSRGFREFIDNVNLLQEKCEWHKPALSLKDGEEEVILNAIKDGRTKKLVANGSGLHLLPATDELPETFENPLTMEKLLQEAIHEADRNYEEAVVECGKSSKPEMTRDFTKTQKFMKQYQTLHNIIKENKFRYPDKICFTGVAKEFSDYLSEAKGNDSLSEALSRFVQSKGYDNKDDWGNRYTDQEKEKRMILLIDWFKKQDSNGGIARLVMNSIKPTEKEKTFPEKSKRRENEMDYPERSK